MLSLGPELWKIFWVLVLSEVSSWSVNGPTFANVRREKLENLVSQQRSKSRITNSTFSDNDTVYIIICFQYFWTPDISFTSLWLCRPVRPSIHSFVCPSERPPVHPSNRPFVRSLDGADQSICWSVGPSAPSSIYEEIGAATNGRTWPQHVG